MSDRTEWGVRRTQGDVGSVMGPMWKSEAISAANRGMGDLVSRTVTYGEWTDAESEETP